MKKVELQADSEDARFIRCVGSKAAEMIAERLDTGGLVAHSLLIEGMLTILYQVSPYGTAAYLAAHADMASAAAQGDKTAKARALRKMGKALDRLESDRQQYVQAMRRRPS